MDIDDISLTADIGYFPTKEQFRLKPVNSDNPMSDPITIKQVEQIHPVEWIAKANPSDRDLLWPLAVIGARVT